MHMGYFGDSYDLVKRAFISWLSAFGPWHVQPMFTDEVTAGDAARFASFIGAALVSHDRLTPGTNRDTFFRSSRHVTNLFLDADTGLRAKATGKKAPCYVMYSELTGLVLARPQHLTLVYDQSIKRAKNEEVRAQLKGKLDALRSDGVLGFYYVSHAPMLVATGAQQTLNSARARILECLPEHRLLS